MLVVSRRPEETIQFKHLGITVRIVRVNGNIVRVGVEAPNEVKVIRGEMARPDEPAGDPKVRDAICQLLAAQEYRAAGEAELAEAALEKAVETLRSVDAAAAPPKVRPRVALIVEDDANQRELLAGLLRIQGWECATAVDGEEAIRYLNENKPPDVVLLDMWMPRIDGPELVRAIRNNPDHQSLKLFALSGTPPESVGLNRGPDGIDRWFAKPLNARALFQAVDDVANVEAA